MSDITLEIESPFRLNIDFAIALCFTLGGLVANLAAVAMGVVIA